MPDVDLARLPVPSSAALMVPLCRAKLPLDDSEPSLMKPPTRVTPPFWTCVVPPRSSVPPATVTALVVAPSVPTPDSASVPPMMVVPPLYVLAPASVIAPVPVFTSEPPVVPAALQPAPPRPQSPITPLTVVLKPLPPTVSWLAPR